MLRNSLSLLLFLLNIFQKDLRVLIGIFLIEIILNLLFTDKVLTRLKKLKILLYIYMIVFITQIYYNQSGKVLLKIYTIYITEEGLYHFGVTFIKIINLILISWLVNIKGRIPSYLKNYQEIIEDVMELVPEVFKIFKKRGKIKWFFKDILKKIDKMVTK